MSAGCLRHSVGWIEMMDYASWPLDDLCQSQWKNRSRKQARRGYPALGFVAELIAIQRSVILVRSELSEDE